MTVDEVIKQYMLEHNYTALVEDSPNDPDEICTCVFENFMDCDGRYNGYCIFGYYNDCSTCANKGSEDENPDGCFRCPSGYDGICDVEICYVPKEGA